MRANAASLLALAALLLYCFGIIPQGWGPFIAVTLGLWLAVVFVYQEIGTDWTDDPQDKPQGP